MTKWVTGGMAVLMMPLIEEAIKQRSSRSDYDLFVPIEKWDFNEEEELRAIEARKEEDEYYENLRRREEEELAAEQERSEEEFRFCLNAAAAINAVDLMENYGYTYEEIFNE